MTWMSSANLLSYGVPRRSQNQTCASERMALADCRHSLFGGFSGSSLSGAKAAFELRSGFLSEKAWVRGRPGVLDAFARPGGLRANSDYS